MLVNSGGRRVKKRSSVNERSASPLCPISVISKSYPISAELQVDISWGDYGGKQRFGSVAS